MLATFGKRGALDTTGAGAKVTRGMLGITGIRNGGATLSKHGTTDAGGGAIRGALETADTGGEATPVTLGITGAVFIATLRGIYTPKTSAVHGRRPREARWWLIVAMVAAVMVSIRGAIEGRESALAAESQGVYVGIARVRPWARRGGTGRIRYRRSRVRDIFSDVLACVYP